MHPDRSFDESKAAGELFDLGIRRNQLIELRGYTLDLSRILSHRDRCRRDQQEAYPRRTFRSEIAFHSKNFTMLILRGVRCIT